METSGFLLVDKPLEWTSHDVVAKLRGITGIKKIGHGGTLDPLATGLLVIGIGKATKGLERFVQGDKSYAATVRLGVTSSTDDAEGELTEQLVDVHPDEAAVVAALQDFQGEIGQLPPVYSALKTAGRKHYQFARAGQPVEREPRRVTIHSIELRAYSWPTVEFNCRVSKGTYIRAIARDIGERLGTGGYLGALRRTAVGKYSVDDASTLEQLQGDWRGRLIASDERAL